MRLLTARRVHIREQHKAEIGAEVAELLRRGWTAEQLNESIADPTRPRTEWPREWRGRLPARPPKPARTPPDAAEVAQKRNAQADEREIERQALADFLGGRPPSEKLRAKRSGK